MKKEQSHINRGPAPSERSESRGFSLVELLVAVSIFLVFVIAITLVTANIPVQMRNSANKERATVLAEEALEATRNIRDSANDFANLPDGTYGLSTSGNIFSLSGVLDVTDIFTRVLNISTINGNQKKVDVTISWADQISPTNSIALKTYLTNWRAPLNIGLTVDKVVVGGTKVPSDFLPINLNTNVWDNTVDPPVLQNIDIPIVFSPSTMSNLSPGIYTFLTSSDPNYTLSLSSACLGNSITLTNGAIACTITYTSNSVAPTVTTTAISSITRTTATSGGNVTSDGGASVTARGVVWDTSINPTIALSTKTSNGTGTGSFSGSITSLTCNTLYHVRAYATNSVGTSYGSDVQFTTSACDTQASYLTVNTAGATLTNSNRTLSGITLTNTGGSAIVVDKVTVTWTKASRTINNITISGASKWSGTANSGTLLDITNTTLNVGVSNIASTYVFSGSMSTCTFTITYTMTDGSTKIVTGIVL